MPEKIVIAVGVAAQPIAAVGITWTSMNWPLAFRELGWDVWIVEAIGSGDCVDAVRNAAPAGSSANVGHWRKMVDAFSFEGRATLLIDDEAESLADLRDFAAEASVFLNLSGHFVSDAVSFPRAVKVYHDGDPAFTQTWVSRYGCDLNFDRHDRFFTAGTNFNSARRFAPTCGLEWIPTFPPVSLTHWPFKPAGTFDRFTTIAHWEGYKNVEWQDVWFTGKREEFQSFIGVPGMVNAPIEIAMHVEDHAGEIPPFREAGWHFQNSTPVCANLESYARYIGESSAEFSVCKGGYAVSQTGWFSDRSVCYAASGRPIVVQDTNVDSALPRGKGFLPFANVEEAVAACNRVIEDFPAQQIAARQLAEEFFEGKKVASRMLDRL